VNVYLDYGGANDHAVALRPQRMPGVSSSS
jgi:hypothetical protein